VRKLHLPEYNENDGTEVVQVLWSR